MVDENDDYTNTPQAVQPNDYNKLVEETKSGNPKILIERLSIPKELICPPKFQDESDISRMERNSNDVMVIRSGRMIRTPTKYQSFETDKYD